MTDSAMKVPKCCIGRAIKIMHMPTFFISEPEIDKDTGTQLCGGDPGLSSLPYHFERASVGDRSKSHIPKSMRFHSDPGTDEDAGAELHGGRNSGHDK